MDPVRVYDGIFLGSDSDDLTFVGVKLHLPLLFPILEVVKVFL